MYSRRYYYVYIMTNRSRTLYTGITSNLSKRVFQHKTGAFPGFTSRYRIDRLVHYEPSSAWPPPSNVKSKSKGCFGLRSWHSLCP